MLVKSRTPWNKAYRQLPFCTGKLRDGLPPPTIQSAIAPRKKRDIAPVAENASPDLRLVHFHRAKIAAFARLGSWFDLISFIPSFTIPKLNVLYASYFLLSASVLQACFHLSQHQTDPWQRSSLNSHQHILLTRLSTTSTSSLSLPSNKALTRTSRNTRSQHLWRISSTSSHNGYDAHSTRHQSPRALPALEAPQIRPSLCLSTLIPQLSWRWTSLSYPPCPCL